MYKHALTAYETSQKTAIQLKELERLVIAQATYRMTSARKNFTHSKKSYDKYADALKYNQKLWTLIQINIADNPNSGSAALRRSLLNLSLFIDKQTMTALRNPDPNSLIPLVEINKTVSGGLHGQTKQSEQKAQKQEFAIPNMIR